MFLKKSRKESVKKVVLKTRHGQLSRIESTPLAIVGPVSIHHNVIVANTEAGLIAVNNNITTVISQNHPSCNLLLRNNALLLFTQNGIKYFRNYAVSNSLLSSKHIIIPKTIATITNSLFLIATEDNDLFSLVIDNDNINLLNLSSRTLFYSFTPSFLTAINTILHIAVGFQNKLTRSTSVFVLTNKSIQSWSISKSSSTMDYEVEILSTLSQTLSIPTHQISLLKIDILKDNSILLLLSTTTSTSHYSYLLCTFSTSQKTGLNTASASLRPLLHKTAFQDYPKLMVSNGGPTLFVVFEEAVLISTVLPDVGGSFFEEVIPLRNLDADPILDVYVDNNLMELNINQSGDVSGGGNMDVLYLFRKKSGFLNLEVLNDAVFSNEGRTNNVSGGHQIRTTTTTTTKSKLSTSATKEKQILSDDISTRLEQGVFFGTFDNNNSNHFEKESEESTWDENGNSMIVAFEIPDSGDLNAACLGLSEAILSGKSKFIKDFGGSVVEGLQEREFRMLQIVNFVGYVKKMDLLTDATRYKLMFNQEKVRAALFLWNLYDSEDESNKLIKSTILPAAITKFYEKSRIAVPESSNPIKHFFQHHIASIAEVLANLSVPPLPTTRTPKHLLPHLRNFLQTTKLLLVTLGGGMQCRQEICQVYDNLEGKIFGFGVIDFESPHLPWWSTSEVMVVMKGLFNDANRWTKECAGVAEVDVYCDGDEWEWLGKAAVEDVFMVGERILEGAFEEVNCYRIKGKNGVVDKLLGELEVTRVLVFDALFAIDQERCFYVAEKFLAFKSLAELTLKTNPSQINDRLSSLISKLGQNFFNVLMTTFLEQGMANKVFDERLTIKGNFNYDELLDEFLGNLEALGVSDKIVESLAWIQDLKMGRPGYAGDSMRMIGKRETNVKKQKVSASIALLCYYESIDDIDEITEEQVIQREITQIEVQLELKSRLLTRFQFEISPLSPSLTPKDVLQKFQTKTTLTKPTKQLIEKALTCLLSDQSMSFFLLVNLLIFFGDDYVTGFEEGVGMQMFDLAIDLIFDQSEVSEEGRSAVVKMVWARAYRLVKFRELMQSGSDSEIRIEFRHTGLYALMKKTFVDRKVYFAAETIPTPEELGELKAEWKLVGGDERDLEAFVGEAVSEHNVLKGLVDNGIVEQIWAISK